MNNVSHWFQDKHFSPHFNVSEIGLLLTSDGASSFNWQHFSFLVACKIMVHLTIDSVLDLMKCSNNDVARTKNWTVWRNIQMASGALRRGAVGEQHYLLSVPSPVTLVEARGFSQMSPYLSFHRVSVHFLLHRNQSSHLERRPTCNDFPAPRVKVKHLAWMSGSTRVPNLLSALFLILSLLSQPSRAFDLTQCFPECRTVTLSHVRCCRNMALNSPESPPKWLMQFRVLSALRSSSKRKPLLEAGKSSASCRTTSLCNKERARWDNSI